MRISMILITAKNGIITPLIYKYLNSRWSAPNTQMAKASIQKMAKIVNKSAPATLPKPAPRSVPGDIPELEAMDNGIPELDDIQKKYFTKSQVEGELLLAY